jgi:hypothetical protein
MPTQANLPAPLAEAGLALREVLERLDTYSKNRVKTIDTSSRYATAAMQHVGDLDALMIAVQNYEEAVIACLPSASSNEAHILEMSPAELLAYRQTDPVYRLGWVRGHKAGVTQAAQAPDAALRLYAKHANLPATPDTDTFIEGMRRRLTQWNERYSIVALFSTKNSELNHGNV